MSQAIVNPEELRRFAARLKQFNNEMIAPQLTALHGQLAGLSQTCCATGNTTSSLNNSSRRYRS